MSAKHFVSLSIIAATFAAAASALCRRHRRLAEPQSSDKSCRRATTARCSRPAKRRSRSPSCGTSTLSRGDVRYETVQARARREMVPAGQGPSFAVPAGTQLARAEVRESVRQANMNGELMRAGEGVGPVERRPGAHFSRAEVVAMRTRR